MDYRHSYELQHALIDDDLYQSKLSVTSSIEKTIRI